MFNRTLAIQHASRRTGLLQAEETQPAPGLQNVRASVQLDSAAAPNPQPATSPCDHHQHPQQPDDASQVHVQEDSLDSRSPAALVDDE